MALRFEFTLKCVSAIRVSLDQSKTLLFGKGLIRVIRLNLDILKLCCLVKILIYQNFGHKQVVKHLQTTNLIHFKI